MAAEDSGLDEELYGDEPKSDESDSGSSNSKPTESVDEKAAENLMALLPLSALGGKAKAGDRITMKIVKLHGDEAEVEISESSQGEDGKKSDDDELRELDEMEA